MLDERAGTLGFMRRGLLQFALLTTVSWSILHAQSARAQTQTELPQVTVEVPRVVHANAPRRNVKPKRRPVVAVTRPAAPESAAGSVAQPNGPPVTMTTAGPVSGYQALTATTSTKTATPIEHIPQSIVVLPRSIIDDQYPVAQNDILHNVSSVSGMTENSVSGFYYKVRGFMAE